MEEHWTPLNMPPITIAINVSNASYHLGFCIVFLFMISLWQTYAISIETCMKVFPVLEFSVPSEL